MDILEGILTGAAKEILGTYHIQWLGHDVDLTPSWKRMTMADAVQECHRAPTSWPSSGDDDAGRGAGQERRRGHGGRGPDVGQRPV